MNIKKHIRSIWNDSVFSKVISSGLLLCIGIIPTLNYSFFCKIVLMGLLILLIIIIWYIIIYQNPKKRSYTEKDTLKTGNEPIESTETIHEIREETTIFFSQRISEAFPGERGIIWYNSPKSIIKHLNIFFKNPFFFNRRGSENTFCDPIQLYRGSINIPIEKFKIINHKKILLNNLELRVKRMAVNCEPRYDKQYIYLECEPDTPTDLDTITPQFIRDRINNPGYAYEEYGLYNNKIPITRLQYDDNAIWIKNKHIPLKPKNCEFRIKYLTPFNFILCAKQSPYNSNRFIINSPRLFNDILYKNLSPDSLFNFLHEFDI